MKLLNATKQRQWIKPFLTLVCLFALSYSLPDKTVDPWNIFNPKKMSTMVLALTFIQFAGALLLQLLGTRVGAILTGFLGGLISSTATVATLAKKSKTSIHKKNTTSEILIFLAATIAMLAEGISILLFGSKNLDAAILIVFLGPTMAASILIFLNTKKSSEKTLRPQEDRFDLLPILKLSAFIVAILSISKILQTFLGKSGLLVFTFVVSLFEIHGSFIANIQLHDAGAFDSRMLGNLVAVSIAASCLSKLFLIHTLGSVYLKVQARKLTFYLLIALAASWLVFNWVG